MSFGISGNSVIFVGQTQVNNGQNHEDEGLQRDDEYVEYCPGKAQYRLYEPGQEGYQYEDEFTGVHVAEKSQGQRNRTGKFFYQFQEQVEGYHPFAKGTQQHFLGKTDGALDLDTVKQDQEKYGN